MLWYSASVRSFKKEHEEEKKKKGKQLQQSTFSKHTFDENTKLLTRDVVPPSYFIVQPYIHHETYIPQTNFLVLMSRRNLRGTVFSKQFKMLGIEQSYSFNIYVQLAGDLSGLISNAFFFFSSLPKFLKSCVGHNGREVKMSDYNGKGYRFRYSQKPYLFILGQENLPMPQAAEPFHCVEKPNDKFPLRMSLIFQTTEHIFFFRT